MEIDYKKELQEAYDCLGRVLTLKVSIDGTPVSNADLMSWRIEEARDFLERKGRLGDYIQE